MAITNSTTRRMLRRQTLYKATALFFGLYVIGMFAYATLQPDTFRIERSIQIHAPAEKIFTLLNDLHQVPIWSPWEKNDVTVNRNYVVTRSGAGSVYEWYADSDVLQGRMEIISSVPASMLVIGLDLNQPYETRNTVNFILLKQSDDTLLTQTVYGPSPWLSKLLGLAFDMNKMLGDKYEAGLGRLKTVAEQ